MKKVVVVVTLALAAIVGTIYMVEALGRRDRRRNAAVSFAGSHTRFSILAAFARVNYVNHGCRNDVTSLSGIPVCDSIELRMADASMMKDCWDCVPDGSPSATCERVRRAIVFNEIWDNPCDK